MKRKIMAVILTAAMTVSLLAGCGNKNENKTDGNESGNESGSEEAVVDLEIWSGNLGFLAPEKGGAVYDFYKELIGVGITQPYVEWGGGSTYQQQLNLKITAGEMPDMFMPFNGMESDLIKNGALLDLSEYLPEMAPNLWAAVPEEVWNIMRSYDPSGEGGIYTIPSIVSYTLMSGLVRQDWLDALNLSMPTTQDEFVEVLRAFKEGDPNGNGIADEIPTGGRADVKWMDHLFSMYGLAMWEGAPEWDIYDGELTYSAVTENMRDALEFISGLYAEGLMDPETLLNDKAGWEGKINSDKVGIVYHWAEQAYAYAESLESSTGTKADWVVMPAISAPGYEAYYTKRQVSGASWVVKNTDDEAKIEAIMKVLDAYGNSDLWDIFYYGVEGMHSEVQDGVLTKLPDDYTTMENMVLQPSLTIASLDYRIGMFEDMTTDDREWSLNQAVRNLRDVQIYGKEIAGDGMPASVYDGYADILNRTLYIEYASKIITGEYSIDKFDEFVEKWYSSGGEQVTKAAREWYAGVTE